MKKAELLPTPAYTPLPDARITEPVRIDMASLGHYIPEWAGRDKIGVNMEVLAAVAQLMRMRSLTVLGMREKGEEEIVISGVFEDGSATGTASGTLSFQNRVRDSGEKPFWESLENFNMDFGRESDFRDFVIRLNLAALEYRLANGNSPVRDPSQWADFINRELAKELKKLAWKRFSPDARKIALEMLLPFLAYCRIIAKPTIEALKGKWDWKALVRATSAAMLTPLTLGISYELTNDPKAAAILIYLMLTVGSKKEERDFKNKEAEDSTEPYDPVTPFTFANFEWDRLLEVRRLIARYKLVTVLEEIKKT